MERDFFHSGFFSEFQRSSNGGGGDTSFYEGIDDDDFSLLSSDIDSMFSGVSFLSLLNSNPTDHFDFFTLMPPLLPQTQHYHFPNIPHYPQINNIPISPLFSSSPSFDNIPDSLSLPSQSPILKSPKLEPSLALSLEYDTSTKPNLFHTLPDLSSLDSPSSSSSAAPKRRRFDSDPSAVVVPRSSALARQRRQKLGDKTRYLQKLLPWDKKMSTTTMLEETYKYVKFLQAQLAALQAMPTHSYFSSSSSSSSSSVGVLGRLNRNQLLQVLVNSPVAQTLLSSQGRCVFSVEQLDMLITRKRINNTTTASLLSAPHTNLL